jgi:hypothetical protein
MTGLVSAPFLGRIVRQSRRGGGRMAPVGPKAAVRPRGATISRAAQVTGNAASMPLDEATSPPVRKAHIQLIARGAQR